MEKTKSTIIAVRMLSIIGPQTADRRMKGLLWCFKGEDGQDRPAVHSPHAGTVAHEVQQESGYLRAQLKTETTKDSKANSAARSEKA